MFRGVVEDVCVTCFPRGDAVIRSNFIKSAKDCEVYTSAMRVSRRLGADCRSGSQVFCHHPAGYSVTRRISRRVQKAKEVVAMMLSRHLVGQKNSATINGELTNVRGTRTKIYEVLS